MIQYKFDTLPPEFTQAMQNIAEGNKLESRGKKLKEIGKAYIADFLKRERGLDIDALPIGEMVSVNNGFFVLQIDKQNRFDADAYALAHPAEYAALKRDFPVTKFKV